MSNKKKGVWPPVQSCCGKQHPIGTSGCPVVRPDPDRVGSDRHINANDWSLDNPAN